MVNMEPYKQIQKTNIKEHNDLVGKINEIVDVINNADLENIGPKVDAIEVTDTLQWKDIESIKAKDTEQDSTLATHTTEITELTKSLVSNVALMNGTTAGNMKVRIERESAPSIDSNDYNIQKPTSVELVQGSAPAMVKAQITLSDGTVLVSDDFMFTTEAIGQDVYISSFVFKNGNVAGTISADIGLSNGSTLTANNFAVPTDPNVLSTIADLTTRTEALEQIDIGALKTTVDGNTASIEALNNDVTDIMLNKADVNNVNQVIVAKQIDLESIVRIESQSESAKFGLIGGNPTYPFTITHETEAFGQIVDKPIGSIAMLDTNGNPKNFKAGGNKTLYTQAINTLWEYDSSNTTYTIPKDFTIVFVYVYNNFYGLTSMLIPAGTYPVSYYFVCAVPSSSGVGVASLGLEHNNISIKANNVNVTQQYTAFPFNTGYGYAIFV